MQLTLNGLGKRYNRRWIFRDISIDIPSGSRLGITGHNGSGKSTLLKVMSGALPASAGTVEYSGAQGVIAPDKVYRQLTYAAPYTDLIEELSLIQMLRFHARFKPWRAGFEEGEILRLLGKRFGPGAIISSFSSGMKQRLRLVLAVASESDLICLDEPTSNLDEEGKHWYSALLERIAPGETVLIASNESFDMQTCDTYLNVEDYSGLK